MIERTGLVAIVRGTSEDSIIQIAKALYAGWIRAIEVTFNTPGAARMVETLSDEFGDRMLVGAGTVLDAETARTAILAGARFVLSPSLDPGMVKMCNRYSVLAIPGVMSPTEMAHALELGCSYIKLFPAGVLGPSYVKSILGPIPQARIMAVGGVTLRNAGALLEAGARSVGVGGALVDRKAIERNDFQSLTRNAEKWIEVLASAGGGTTVVR